MRHRMNAVFDPIWLTGLRERADLPPSIPRMPLTIDAQVCGSLEASLAQQMVAAGLPLRARDAGWAVDGIPDAALSDIAQWLHRHGHGGRWRDELLAVTNDSGQVLAAIERAAVRPLGIATRAAHLVGTTSDGRVWVQRRALDKSVDPGMLDTLVGGLVAFGESTGETLERESWEEAGLRVAQLHDLRPMGQLMVRRPLSDGYVVERIDMFAAVVPDGITPRNQDCEGMDFECLAIDALVNAMRG